MTGIRKRIIACSMALLLLPALLPADALAAEVRQALAGDVWSAVEELEQEGLDEAAVLMDAGSDPAKDPDYYASLSGKVEALVTARPDYEPGSLIRHGEFFFWKDTDGVVYGYSPDLRAQLNGAYGPDDVPAAEDTEAMESEIAALERAQTARTETASDGAMLMGGTTTNPDVAVFIPHYPNFDNRFTKSAYFRGLQIAEATGGTCTCYNGSGVTIDSLAEALTQCGVVLFHTHGSTDAYYNDRSDPGNTAYLTIKNETGIDWTGKDGEKATGKYGEYYHVFKSGSGIYCIDGTAIVSHVKGTVVTDLFGLCCCMGMKNDGLCRPLRSAGVEVVYGYSQSVTFSTDKLHQRFLAEALVKGRNGGGIARYMKEQMCQYGLDHWTLTDDTRKDLTSLGSICWDPYKSDSFTEEEARNKGDAFLLFCTSEDPYPAEGQRDRAQTVKSIWKLSLAGGGTGSGDIRMSSWINDEIEYYFPNVTKMELLSGDLPGGVAIETKSFGGEKIDALCGNVSNTPGYYEAAFRVTFSDGTTGTRRAEILVSDREIQNTRETIVAEPGVEQDTDFVYLGKGDVYESKMIKGELPQGLAFRTKDQLAGVQGTPILPGWYVSEWRLFLFSGLVVDHTVRIHIPGTVIETSESFLASIYNLNKIDLDVKDPSAVVEMDLLSGSLPPGMNWSYSSSEAPRIYGEPTEEGTWSSRFRFLCSDGTIQYHTVNVTAFIPGYPITSYTVYVGGGEALVPRKEYSDYLLNTLKGALDAGQIGGVIPADGETPQLDLDKDGNCDVVGKPVESGKFILFQKAESCSVSEDTFTLSLNSEAMTKASYYGAYTENLVFRLADRFDLYVDGVQVTTDNMPNILGDGVFSFDGGVTLSVHGDYLAIGDKPVIRNEMPNLVIQVEEDSLLESAGTDCIRTNQAMTIRGPGKLTLETPENGILIEGMLVELQNLDLQIDAGKKGICSDGTGTPYARIIRSDLEIDSGTGAVVDFWNISLDHCMITEPVYGQVKEPLPASTAKYQCLVDKDRKLLTRAKITANGAEYDLWIDGIQVTDHNQMDVLGDGKFSYNETSNILNISGSLESSETIVSSGIDGLWILAAPDTELKTSDNKCLELDADTVLSGGPLTVISTSKMGHGINVQSDSDLTLSNLYLTAGGRFAIDGETETKNSLRVMASNVTASGTAAAIRGFSGGIALHGCALASPAAGTIADGAVKEGDTIAKQAVICHNSVSVSGKDLSYNLYLPGSGTAKLIAAWYDGAGKLLGTAVTEKPRGAFVSGAIQVKQGADHYKLFALDENSAPILAALPCSG